MVSEVCMFQMATIGVKGLRGHCEAIMYFDELAAAGRVSHCFFEAISDYGWGYLFSC